MKIPSLRFPEEKNENARIERRRTALLENLEKKLSAKDFQELFSTPFPVDQVGQKNCENLLGSVSVPVGVAGPVQVKAAVLEEKIMIPMATTEGALVASYNRGCKVIDQAGGAEVFVKKIGISRAPVFSCQDGAAARKFLAWLEKNQQKVAAVAEETSNHLRFKHFESWLRGKYLYVRFVFDPDQAMGMNMASIALQHVWDNYLSQEIALKKWQVKLVALSSNVCVDKKDSAINQLLGRGYEVQAEVVIPHRVLKKLLKVTAEDFFHTHVVKNLQGSSVAGSTSQNMHFANGLAALFLATGQDPAHVAETSQGSTIVEVQPQGLYIAVALPDLPLGVVGGGTWLPAQTQARKLIRFGKDISSEQLAAAIGVGVLAGELSGIAALTDHQLAAAHQQLAR